MDVFIQKHWGNVLTVGIKITLIEFSFQYSLKEVKEIWADRIRSRVI